MDTYVRDRHRGGEAFGHGAQERWAGRVRPARQGRGCAGVPEAGCVSGAYGAAMRHQRQLAAPLDHPEHGCRHEDKSGQYADCGHGLHQCFCRAAAGGPRGVVRHRCADQTRLHARLPNGVEIDLSDADPGRLLPVLELLGRRPCPGSTTR